MRETLVWINPRNYEYRMPLINSPLDKRVFRPEIEHIKFVDPRRHNEERAPFDVSGRGSVLDQLHQLILEYDLSRRGGYVLTNAEGLQVGHRDYKSSATEFEVIQQNSLTL